MPRGLFNWTYKDVANFAKEHGFILDHSIPGSHEFWINYKTNAVINVHYHGQKSFPPRTLETMIRQSELSKKVWRDWASK